MNENPEIDPPEREISAVGISPSSSLERYITSTPRDLLGEDPGVIEDYRRIESLETIQADTIRAYTSFFRMLGTVVGAAAGIYGVSELTEYFGFSQSLLGFGSGPRAYINASKLAVDVLVGGITGSLLLGNPMGKLGRRIV